MGSTRCSVALVTGYCAVPLGWTRGWPEYCRGRDFWKLAFQGLADAGWAGRDAVALSAGGAPHPNGLLAANVRDGEHSCPCQDHRLKYPDPVPCLQAVVGHLRAHTPISSRHLIRFIRTVLSLDKDTWLHSSISQRPHGSEDRHPDTRRLARRKQHGMALHDSKRNGSRHRRNASYKYLRL